MLPLVLINGEPASSVAFCLATHNASFFGRTNKQTSRQTDTRTDGRMNGRTDGHTDIQRQTILFIDTDEYI